jgi:hypothetical protein
MSIWYSVAALGATGWLIALGVIVGVLLEARS